MRVSLCAAVMVLGVLAGCVSSSEEDLDEVEPIPLGDLVPTRGIPVQAVRDLEIGRSRDGFIVTAFGTAPALGYARPRLRPRRDGNPGQDGFIDYDFVADPPKPGLERAQGSLQARQLRADVLLPQRRLRGAAGIRVHSLSGGVELGFGAGASEP